MVHFFDGWDFDGSYDSESEPWGVCVIPLAFGGLRIRFFPFRV